MQENNNNGVEMVDRLIVIYRSLTAEIEKIYGLMETLKKEALPYEEINFFLERIKKISNI